MCTYPSKIENKFTSERDKIIWYNFSRKNMYYLALTLWKYYFIVLFVSNSGGVIIVLIYLYC